MKGPLGVMISAVGALPDAKIPASVNCGIGGGGAGGGVGRRIVGTLEVWVFLT